MARDLRSCECRSILGTTFGSYGTATGTSSDVSRVLTVGVACFNVLMILLSLVSLILETSPEFKKTTSKDIWQTIEILTTGCFTVEYLMRLWVCDVYGSSAVDWFFKPLNVCDLLAIIPVYAEFVVRQWDLEFLRVLRVVRLFKIGRYSEGVRVMNAALFNSLSALYILVFLFVIGSIIFASIIYFTEKLSCPDFSSMNLTQPNPRKSALPLPREFPRPTALAVFSCVTSNMAWRTSRFDSTITFGRRMAVESVEWKVEALNDAEIDSVTMTTVGYGDIVPKHWSSVVVAGFAMVTGILIIAMPFAIVGTKFSEAAASDLGTYRAICNKLVELVEGSRKSVVAEAAGDCPALRHAGLQLQFLNMIRVSFFGRTFHSLSSTSALICLTRPEFAKQLLTQSTSAISEEMKMTPEVSAKTLGPAPEMAVLLEKLRVEVDEALAVKKEILQLQVLRDNLWTSVEHSLARLAFEGCISLNAHMVDGPWFNRRVTKKAKTTVENAVARKSLGFIRREWCIRRTAIDITSSWIFESTVLFLIVANSFALAENHWGNVLMRETEIVFTLFFTLECAIKVVGLLDAMQFEALSFLKPARVLRPLRSLTAVPGIRNLFHTIILSLPGLKDKLLHFWSGILHRSCRLTEQPLHFSPQANCSGWCFDNESLVNAETSVLQKCSAEVDPLIQDFGARLLCLLCSKQVTVGTPGSHIPPRDLLPEEFESYPWGPGVFRGGHEHVKPVDFPSSLASMPLREFWALEEAETVGLRLGVFWASPHWRYLPHACESLDLHHRLRGRGKYFTKKSSEEFEFVPVAPGDVYLHLPSDVYGFESGEEPLLNLWAERIVDVQAVPRVIRDLQEVADDPVTRALAVAAHQWLQAEDQVVQLFGKKMKLFLRPRDPQIRQVPEAAPPQGKVSAEFRGCPWYPSLAYTNCMDPKLKPLRDCILYEEGDTMFGMFFAPAGTYYPAHRHQPWEIYHVIEGEGLFFLGDDGGEPAQALAEVSLTSSIVQIDSSLVFDTYCRTNKNCLSNWESGRDYYVWPLDNSQDRFCGEYVCQARAMSSGSELQVLQLLGSAAENSTQVNTVCGSPLASDAEYGPEVVNTELNGVNLDDWNFEVQGSSRNWGITHFDNVAASFLVVFQSVTLDCWSDVMGMVQDAHSTVVGFIYFLLLIVIGSFFLVNVREQQLEQEREEAAEAQHVGTTEITLKTATRPDGGLRGRGGTFKERPWEPWEPWEPWGGQGVGNVQLLVSCYSCAQKSHSFLAFQNLFDQLFWHRNRTEVEEVLREDSDYKAVRIARAIATNTFFNSGVMIMILVNVVVLAMDRYPEHLVEASVGDVLNFIFNVVFLLECIILHVAVGPLIYWSDNAMAFDGLIVLLSVVDLVNDFASGSGCGSHDSLRVLPNLLTE
eukprot:s291_g14.t1